jgi:signal transduction histidine kinase
MSAVFVRLGLSDRFWFTTLARTATNAFAVLTLVPVISVAAHAIRTNRMRIKWRRVFEALALFAAIGAVASVVFVYAGSTSPPMLYAPFPLLLVATVRFGVVGVCVSLLLLALVAAWGALQLGGPFVHGDSAESALSFVFFLLLNAVSLVLLAGVLGERKAAIAATRESERRRQRSDELYRAILATCEDSIAVLDCEGRIIELNETWRQRLEIDPGIPPDASPGANYFSCLDAWILGVESGQIASALHAVLAGDKSKRRVEYSRQTNDEKVRWIEHTIERLSRPEGGAVIMIADITARKTAELEAQARFQELTHLARVAAVGGLSGAIAHELSQPIGAILGNAEAGLRLMARDRTGSEDVREIFQDIVENSGRASEVIERVRQLLRPGGTAVREPVNLSILVADVLRLVSSDIGRRKVQLRTNLPASLGLANGDPVQVQQVVLNLVLNACEAMEKNAVPERRIIVSTQLSRRRREVELTVRDFGPGVPLQDLEQVFLPFVTSKATGLGLGLFISRRIVEAHRGRLWVEPADPGSTFHMTLPLLD